MNRVPSLIQSTGVALEQETYKQFGAAVENMASGVLGSVFGKGGTTATDPRDAKIAAQQAQIGVWDPSGYAATIASNVGQLQPKNKFLFKIRFDFYEEVKTALRALNPSIYDIVKNVSFVVKSVDLPTVNFTYQDVNLYNFRTRVLKTSSYKDLNITFYDDVSNNSMNFVNLYMMAIMPITRKEHTTGFVLEDSSMAFSQNYFQTDTSYRGVLPLDISTIRYDIISKLYIEQFYLNPIKEYQDLVSAVRMNTFVLHNPRINDMALGELDHERGNDTNVITLSFNFDAMHIMPNQRGENSKTPSIPNSDILSGAEEVNAQVKRGLPSQAGKGNNPYVDILANQGRRIVQTSISDALNKKVGNVAGGALSGAIGKISGGLAAAAANTLKERSSKALESISIPKFPFISKDSNTSASESSQATQTSSGNEI